MTNIIIANIVALIASLLMVYTGIIKRKDKIVLIQTIQISLSVLSNILLGGITGAIINAISCIRNILCYKEKLGKLAKTLIIIASIVPSLMFNNLGFIGVLPIISAVAYTLFMDTKDIIKFKYLTIFIMFLCLVFGIRWCISTILCKPLQFCCVSCNERTSKISGIYGDM